MKRLLTSAVLTGILSSVLLAFSAAALADTDTTTTCNVCPPNSQNKLESKNDSCIYATGAKNTFYKIYFGNPSYSYETTQKGHFCVQWDSSKRTYSGLQSGLTLKAQYPTPSKSK